MMWEGHKFFKCPPKVFVRGKWLLRKEITGSNAFKEEFCVCALSEASLQLLMARGHPLIMTQRQHEPHANVTAEQALGVNWIAHVYLSFVEGLRLLSSSCSFPCYLVIRAMIVSAASQKLGMTLVSAAGRRRFNEIFWVFSYAHATPLRSAKHFGVITGKLVMLPPHKHFTMFKIKLLYSPFTVIGRCLQVHTPAPTQTGKTSFPRASAAAQGEAKGSSSVLVLEFLWENFIQYLKEELQTSLPVYYLAIHLTQNTLPQKMIEIKILISHWNLICGKCKATVLTGCFSGLLVSPLPTSSMPSAGKSTQKCKKLFGWHIRSQLIQNIDHLWNVVYSNW